MTSQESLGPQWQIPGLNHASPVSVKNTFLQLDCDLPPPAEGCRSSSCPPLGRSHASAEELAADISQEAASAADKPKSSAAAPSHNSSGTSTKPPRHRAQPSVRDGAGLAILKSAAAAAVASIARPVRGPTSAKEAVRTPAVEKDFVRSSSKRPPVRKLDYRMVMKAIARGPPPYPPPVHLRRGQDERACGAVAGSDSSSLGKDVSAAKFIPGKQAACSSASDVITQHLRSADNSAHVCADAEDIPKGRSKSAEPAEIAGQETASASASASKASPNDQDDWAVVEVKRKKRPQPKNSCGDTASSPAQDYPQQAVASARSQTHIGEAPARSQALLHHQLEVGIAEEPEFRVVRKLLGPSGENMRRITNECPDTKVELRGFGTKSSGSNSGPLVLHIKSHDASQCAKAVAMATELMSETREEYKAFLARRLTKAADSGQGESAKVFPESVDSQEESTSADDSVQALQDATDSEKDDAIDGGLADVWTPSLHRGAVPSKLACKPAAGVERQRPERGKASGKHTVALAASAGPPIHHEVLVGIEHSQQFPAVRRLIGPSGENMRQISNACPGTKVELRGAGTNPWSGGETGPLVLHIRGRDPSHCATALNLANELIDGVRKEYEQYLESQAIRSA